MMTMIELVDMSYDINSEVHLNTQMLLSLCNKHKSGINIDLMRSSDNFENFDNYDNSDKLGYNLHLLTITAPFEFLKLLQNYTNPSPADVNIINVLSNKYGFTTGVINAIVFYTLKQCDDKLPLKYVEKVAATLARKKVTTALGALNALKGDKNEKEINDIFDAQIEESQNKSSIDDLMKRLENV